MGKDDATWLNIAYVCFAALVAFFVYQAIETTGLQTGWTERYQWFAVGSTLGAVIVGSLMGLLIKGNPDRHNYYLAAIGELRKVAWPSWADTKRMTLIVCVVVGIFAVLLGAFDYVWAWVLKGLLA